MNRTLILSTTSAFVIGSALSFVITHKVMTTKFDRLLDEEIKEAKLYYSQLYKVDEFSDPEVLAQKYLEEKSDGEDADEALGDSVETAEGILTNYSSKFTKFAEDSGRPERAEAIVRNIFDRQSLGEFNYDNEVAKRSRDHPYIITHIEFMQNDFEYDQDTLTYYEGDKVLSESNDEEVKHVDEMVGQTNLERFGQGSNDVNVVYIRNEKTRMEYEILHSSGTYAKEVHGIDPDEI